MQFCLLWFAISVIIVGAVSSVHSTSTYYKEICLIFIGSNCGHW